MKPIEKETKMGVSELSQEDLQNTFGGAWVEIKNIDGKLVFIFHPYDDDKPN